MQHLGTSISTVKEILSGNHPFSKRLGQAKKPLIILGAQQLKRRDGAALIALVQQLAQKTSETSKVSIYVNNELFLICNTACVVW